MSRYYYDLHIHSCLSPCGDDESTPDSIAGMGELNGLDLMALTDHNTCKNCPAFFEAAARHGIIQIAGMELTTAEDIHIVCLFPDLASAMAFDGFVASKRIRIRNRTDIFGNQLIMDSFDHVIGTEDDLLSNATALSLEEVPEAVRQFGGVCYPAHIDRQANGIIAVLGVFPETPFFPCAELHDGNRKAEFAAQIGKDPVNILVSSDAHTLWDIHERQEWLELPCPREDAAAALIRRLGGTV